MTCKKCGAQSPATLCSLCFLDEVSEAVERGEEDPSKILKGLVVKYGRLRHIKELPSYQAIFGKKAKLRRTITTEAGQKCRLVPVFEGWRAVPLGELLSIEETPEEKILRYSPESTQGGRVITYHLGSKKIQEVHTPTSLVFRRFRPGKRTKYITSGPPDSDLRSSSEYTRPESPLD